MRKRTSDLSNPQSPISSQGSSRAKNRNRKLAGIKPGVSPTCIETSRIDFACPGLYHRAMVKLWHSLAWKIATANILLAVFAVIASMAVRYRAERQAIENDIRRELTQSVATGSLLVGGDQAEALVDNPDPSAQKNLDAILRSLAGGTPGLDHLYVLARVAGRDPRLLGGLGLAPGAEFAPVGTGRTGDVSGSRRARHDRTLRGRTRAMDFRIVSSSRQPGPDCGGSWGRLGRL